MGKKNILLMVSLQVVFSAAWAQKTQRDWLSPARLTFSLGSSYHFNPWKNYNRALETATQQIRLDAFFFEPTGFYEKINGDATARAAIGYEIFKRVQIQLTGQYGEFDSRFEFYPDSSKIPRGVTSVAFHQGLGFNLRSLGFGLSYQLPIKKRFAIHAMAGLDRYTGKLDLRWRHTRSWRGPLPEDQGEQMQAKLKAHSWGWNLAAVLSYKLIGPVSFTAGAEYRHAKLTNLTGAATYGFPRSPESLQPFTAQLVTASNYFGVAVKEQSNPQALIDLPPLTFLTAPDSRARVPATIDLTALGLSAGLKIGF